MSTNHNRIKVADLETNEPNKTLITNDNGELEFSDITGGEQDLQSVLNTGNSGFEDILLHKAIIDGVIIEKGEDNTGFRKNEISNLSRSSLVISCDEVSNPNKYLSEFRPNYIKNSLYNSDSTISNSSQIDPTSFTQSFNFEDTNTVGSLSAKTDLTGINTICRLKFPLKNGTYEIATTDDIPDVSNFVRKTGEVAETIDGTKLFRSTIKIKGVDDEVSTSVSSDGVIYGEHGYPSLRLAPNHLGGGEGTYSSVEIPRKSGTLVMSVNGEAADESGNVVIAGSNVDASATTSGSINNTSLQELGGVDKLINGVRIGKGAGVGVENTALGFETLQSNTGGYNTGVGYNSLKANTSGSGNLGTGSSSLISNTTGSRNTGVGSYSLYTNTTGEYNTGVGNNALYSNTTGSSNVATGTYAMLYNTTGHHNVSIGEQSLYTNQFGNFNTAIGAGALYYNAGTSGSNIFGHQCTAIGAGSMAFNTTGTGTAVGAFSLYKQTTGTHNLVFGFQSGGGITTGSNNTIIAGTGFITIGGGITTGSNNLIVAQNNGNTTGITTGSGNTVIGKVTGLAAAATNTVTIADGVGNIALTKSTAGEIAAPNLTNALINSGGNKSLLTLEYLNSKIGTTAPASATATGTVGEIRVASGYIYWCTAPNTWIRAAGSTF